MPNLMTNIYIGYIEEIIYKNGLPTLELRVRVPSIHGDKESTGLKKEQLPIAKPILTPGVSFNRLQLIEELGSINKVYVMFESGDHEKPVYFGVKGNNDLYTVPSVESAEGIGNITFAQNTDPALTQQVINGALWFDTLINESVVPELPPEPEPQTYVVTGQITRASGFWFLQAPVTYEGNNITINTTSVTTIDGAVLEDSSLIVSVPSTVAFDNQTYTFIRWVVNNVQQALGQTTLNIAEVTENLTLNALYELGELGFAW